MQRFNFKNHRPFARKAKKPSKQPRRAHAHRAACVLEGLEPRCLMSTTPFAAPSLLLATATGATSVHLGWPRERAGTF